jgi:hypothetical protein
MTKQLRAVLIERRDQALLAAFQQGKTSIADQLVFPSEANTHLGARKRGDAPDGASAGARWVEALQVS